MKIAVGVGLTVLGMAWVLQGLNLLVGNFMTDDRLWIVYGAIITLVGLLVLASSNRRRPGRW